MFKKLIRAAAFVGAGLLAYHLVQDKKQKEFDDDRGHHGLFELNPEKKEHKAHHHRMLDPHIEVHL